MNRQEFEKYIEQGGKLFVVQSQIITLKKVKLSN